MSKTITAKTFAWMTEYSEEEAAEALAECSQQAAPPVVKRAASPSVQKFKPGDRVRMPGLNDLATRTVTRYRDDGRVEYVVREEGRASRTDSAAERNLEFISPASETETEGWVEWKGAGCPLLGDAKRLEVRFRDGDTMQVDVSTLEPRNWLHCWNSGNIVAYRMVKP